MNRTAFALPFLLLTLSCRPEIPLRTLWEGAVSISEERSVPFVLDLDLHSDPPSGAFLVGRERTPVPVVERFGDSVRLEFAGYDAELRGIWNGTLLTGEYVRFRGDTSALPFRAEPRRQPAGADSAGSPGSSAVVLTGSFRAFVESERGTDSTLGARFWAENDSVFGTVLDPSGDHGLMAGVQEGMTVRLARFTGWQANLIELSLAEDRWEGWYFTRNLPPARIRLVPEAPDEEDRTPERTTRMKRPAAPFAFEGITPEGDTVRHTDPQFRGRVLIVDIMGTWCHNCLDAAPLLQKLHEDFADRGLSIVGLAFEMRDNAEAGKRNLRLYRERYGLEFTLLYCGSLAPENVEARLRSQLDDFFAYPTTIFVDRQGRVASIHAGFRGPGTGGLYQQEIRRFYADVRPLLGIAEHSGH